MEREQEIRAMALVVVSRKVNDVGQAGLGGGVFKCVTGFQVLSFLDNLLVT